MASIPVMNPPKHRRKVRRAKKSLKRKVHRKRRVRKVKRAVARRVVKVARRHRKRRVKRVSHRKRRIKRKARRTRRKVRFNPFGSEMVMLGNPTRKRRRKFMARRKRSHRRRGRSLSNPFSVGNLLSKPKEMFTKEFATEAVSTAAGFMLPNIVLGYLPVTLRDTKIKLYASKILVIAGLSAASSMVSKKASRFILIGGGVALLLDLWAEWQARTRPAAPAGTSAYYGDDMSAYYGQDQSNMGDDLVFDQGSSY